MTLGKIDKFIIHFVGNKNNEEGVRFSNSLANIDKIEEYVLNLVSNNFKVEELFHFYFIPNIELNPMFQFVSSIFKEKSTFIEQSQNCSRFLYDKSTHPKIKGGELCVAYIEDCVINGEKTDALGLFKSENKETILKVLSTKDSFELESEHGINTSKLDKGCLIFNIQKENGYLVSIIDNTNRNSEAQYWKDDFLGVQPIKDEYHQTNQFLGIAKQFVTKQLTEEFEVNKADQIDLLNRSVDYFKTNDKFEKEEFEKSVFQSEEIIESFRSFDSSYRDDNEIELSDSFDISSQAVKKQVRAFKKVLKLDKNFHIYIHGDKDLIEHGVENDGRKFYKIYYKDES